MVTAADDKGRPSDIESEQRSKDGTDPELIKISGGRRARHPLIGIVVIGLSLYLMYYVRRDVAYFFQPRVPVDVGEVGEALKKGLLRPNTYVKIEGAPDRKRALLLKGRITGYDSFFRLLQSEDLVYVQRHQRERTTDRVIAGVHSGRLVAFDSLPYRGTIRGYFAKTRNVSHDFELKAVLAAKRNGLRQIKDHKGRLVPLRDDTLFWVNASYDGEWVIQFSKKAYATVDDARKQLADLEMPFIVDDEPSHTFWRFVVLAKPSQVKGLIRRVSKPGLHAGVVKRQVGYAVKWSRMKVDGQALVFDSDEARVPTHYRLSEDGTKLVHDNSRPVRISADTALYISTSSKFTIPQGAMVLMADDRPGDYWHYVLLYAVLCVFVVINAVALRNRVRRRKPKEKVST